jgi:hypothetical protein
VSSNAEPAGAAVHPDAGQHEVARARDRGGGTFERAGIDHAGRAGHRVANEQVRRQRRAAHGAHGGARGDTGAPVLEARRGQAQRAELPVLAVAHVALRHERRVGEAEQPAVRWIEVQPQFQSARQVRDHRLHGSRRFQLARRARQHGQGHRGPEHQPLREARGVEVAQAVDPRRFQHEPRVFAAQQLAAARGGVGSGPPRVPAVAHLHDGHPVRAVAQLTAEAERLAPHERADVARSCRVHGDCVDDEVGSGGALIGEHVRDVAPQELLGGRDVGGRFGRAGRRLRTAAHGHQHRSEDGCSEQREQDGPSRAGHVGSISPLGSGAGRKAYWLRFG